METRAARVRPSELLAGRRINTSVSEFLSSLFGEVLRTVRVSFGIEKWKHLVLSFEGERRVYTSACKILLYLVS